MLEDMKSCINLVLWRMCNPISSVIYTLKNVLGFFHHFLLMNTFICILGLILRSYSWSSYLWSCFGSNKHHLVSRSSFSLYRDQKYPWEETIYYPKDPVLIPNFIKQLDGWYANPWQKMAAVVLKHAKTKTINNVLVQGKYF